MATTNKVEYFKQGYMGVDVSNAESWDEGGGKKWEPGRYVFRADGFGMSVDDQNRPAMQLKLACLAGPLDSEDPTKSRVGDEFYHYRAVDTEQGVNFFRGLIERLCPAALIPALLKNGQYPDGSLVCGGMGDGVIFEAELYEETYPSKKLKKDVTRSRMNTSTINVLIESFAMQQLRTTQQQLVAGVPTPPPNAYAEVVGGAVAPPPTGNGQAQAPQPQGNVAPTPTVPVM
jgi:hypothetical protein